MWICRYCEYETHYRIVNAFLAFRIGTIRQLHSFVFVLDGLFYSCLNSFSYLYRRLTFNRLCSRSRVFCLFPFFHILLLFSRCSTYLYRFFFPFHIPFSFGLFSARRRRCLFSGYKSFSITILLWTEQRVPGRHSAASSSYVCFPILLFIVFVWFCCCFVLCECICVRVSERMSDCLFFFYLIRISFHTTGAREQRRELPRCVLLVWCTEMEESSARAQMHLVHSFSFEWQMANK